MWANLNHGSDDITIARSHQKVHSTAAEDTTFSMVNEYGKSKTKDLGFNFEPLTLDGLMKPLPQAGEPPTFQTFQNVSVDLSAWFEGIF